jgi:hypothetical protein
MRAGAVIHGLETRGRAEVVKVLGEKYVKNFEKARRKNGSLAVG